MLTGSTGTSKRRITYDAYGNVIGSTGTQRSALGYDGQYTSADTGLIYLRARVYDPQTAQFLSVDPIDQVSRAAYAYAGDNPVNNEDPSGLLCFGDYCLGFHPIQGLKANSNFWAGFLNGFQPFGKVGQPFCGPGLSFSTDVGTVAGFLTSIVSPAARGTELIAIASGDAAAAGGGEVIQGIVEMNSATAGNPIVTYTTDNPWLGRASR
jgi:RHS repeat-associated protein